MLHCVEKQTAQRAAKMTQHSDARMSQVVDLVRPGSPRSSQPPGGTQAGVTYRLMWQLLHLSPHPPLTAVAQSHQMLRGMERDYTASVSCRASLTGPPSVALLDMAAGGTVMAPSPTGNRWPVIFVSLTSCIDLWASGLWGGRARKPW